MSRAVDFFIAGAPKCGTTSLYDVLDHHPGVQMSIEKEPRFFELHWDRGRRWFEDECFSAATQGRLRGEASPMYLALPWVPGRLADTYPDARVVLMMRDPLARAESAWWMHYSAGREPLEFDAAIGQNLHELRAGDPLEAPDGEARWVDAVDAIENHDRMALRTYLQSSLYGRNLGRLLGHLPQSQVHVIFTEQLREKPEDVLAGLSRFLALPDPPLRSAHSNAGISQRWSGVTRLLAPVKRSGLVPRPLVELGKRMVAGGRAPRGLSDPALSERLYALFRDDLTTLCALLPEAEPPRRWLGGLG